MVVCQTDQKCRKNTMPFKKVKCALLALPLLLGPTTTIALHFFGVGSGRNERPRCSNACGTASKPSAGYVAKPPLSTCVLTVISTGGAEDAPNEGLCENGESIGSTDGASECESIGSTEVNHVPAVFLHHIVAVAPVAPTHRQNALRETHEKINTRTPRTSTDCRQTMLRPRGLRRRRETPFYRGQTSARCSCCRSTSRGVCRCPIV